SLASDALPDDVDALKCLVIGRDETIAKLLTEIARLKRWRFGRSSEGMDAALMQLQLALDELLVVPRDCETLAKLPLPVEESTQTAPIKPAARSRRVPRAFPEHLPRGRLVHTASGRMCTRRY